MSDANTTQNKPPAANADLAGVSDLLAPYLVRHPVLGLVNDIDASVVSARVGVPWYQLGWKIGRWLADRHPGGGAPAHAVRVPFKALLLAPVAIDGIRPCTELKPWERPRK